MVKSKLEKAWSKIVEHNTFHKRRKLRGRKAKNMNNIAKHMAKALSGPSVKWWSLD